MEVIHSWSFLKISRATHDHFYSFLIGVLGEGPWWKRSSRHLAREEKGCEEVLNQWGEPRRRGRREKAGQHSGVVWTRQHGHTVIVTAPHRTVIICVCSCFPNRTGGAPNTGGGILSIFEALVLGRALNPFVLNAKQPWAGIRIE